VGLNDITGPHAVEQTIVEFDTFGREAFLKQYGFRGFSPEDRPGSSATYFTSPQEAQKSRGRCRRNQRSPNPASPSQ
jgi:hypothetical protein